MWPRAANHRRWQNSAERCNCQADDLSFGARPRKRRLRAKDPLTLRYQIGTTFENVALNGLRNSAAHGTRRLLMNQLAEQLGARVNLVVLKAGNLAFVQWVESTAPLRVEIRGDLPMPVHCSASGKLLLAFGPVELREGVFRSAPFTGYTKNTITTARGLAKELDAIRKRGYSVDDQELLSGVNCLAVPVHNRARQVVAGLAVMAPVASLPLGKAQAPRARYQSLRCRNFGGVGL